MQMAQWEPFGYNHWATCVIEGREEEGVPSTTPALLE